MRKIFHKGGGVYHCMSRCVQGRRLLARQEMAVFRKQLMQAARFSGLEVITFCVMSNHFHVLVRVPPVDTVVSDAELLRRYQALYPNPSKYAPMPVAVLEAALALDNEAAEHIREGLLRRMHDVSEFMRTLKLRFSLWYNRTHDTFGAFWSSRFHAVVVEDKPSVVRLVAAYVDLNPVRAGLAKDPKDYRFCGYAEAVVGVPEARAATCRLMVHELGGPAEQLAAYRCYLFARGMRAVAGKAGVSDEAAERVISKEKGALSPAAYWRARLRFFIGGVAIGSEAFVRSFKAGKKKATPYSTDAPGFEGICFLKRSR